MVCSVETQNGDELANNHLQIIKYPTFHPYNNFSSPWFDLRVFYVRISNFQVDNSTPEFLTLNHIPLSPYTLLEVNGVRCGTHSDGVTSLLRRDRIDKKSEEATFVCTDSIRLNGSVKFEVFDNEIIVLSGVLDMSSSYGFTGETKNSAKKWSMNCESDMTSGSGFLKGKHILGSELVPPIIEVYVAGSFAGTPIILTKTVQLSFRKKQNRKGMLEAIPEYEPAETEGNKELLSGLDEQFAEYGNYKSEYGNYKSEYGNYKSEYGNYKSEYGNFKSEYGDYKSDYGDYKSEYGEMYWNRTGYIDGEEGELSWFNAGVRVGVGIGLGVCVGLGIGVGLLVSTYQSTTRTFKRRLL